MWSPRAPSACTASTLHDFTLVPSRCTVQAPQLLVSQPITVPVLPSFSRRYCTSSIRGSTSSETFVPSTVRLIRVMGAPFGETYDVVLVTLRLGTGCARLARGRRRGRVGRTAAQRVGGGEPALEERLARVRGRCRGRPGTARRPRCRTAPARRSAARRPARGRRAGPRARRPRRTRPARPVPASWCRAAGRRRRRRWPSPTRPRRTSASTCSTSVAIGISSRYGREES